MRDYLLEELQLVSREMKKPVTFININLDPET